MTITPDDFGRVDIRVGTVVAAEPSRKRGSPRFGKVVLAGPSEWAPDGRRLF